MTIMTITFEDVDQKNHKLNFNIYNTDLARRWKENLLHNQNIGKVLNYKFTNTTYEHIGEVRENLNRIIRQINKLYDKRLPAFKDVKVLDTEILNYLHEEFEVYGDRVPKLTTPITWWTPKLHELFIHLNELIHLHEDVLCSKDAKFVSMALLFDYYPQEFFCPILERDKLYLKPDLQWGKVYLGYNTLGKDWMKVQMDNDLDVLLRGQVRPQQRFSAETWINFGPDVGPTFQHRQFEEWYLNLDDDLQKTVPINNLNELCLGRFLIGEVCVDDYLLRHDPNQSNWYVPMSSTKLKWNLNIFSKFRKIKEIVFDD